MNLSKDEPEIDRSFGGYISTNVLWMRLWKSGVGVLSWRHRARTWWKTRIIMENSTKKQQEAYPRCISLVTTKFDGSWRQFRAIKTDKVHLEYCSRSAVSSDQVSNISHCFFFICSKKCETFSKARLSVVELVSEEPSRRNFAKISGDYVVSCENEKFFSLRKRQMKLAA